jgi:hypothetical protein
VTDQPGEPADEPSSPWRGLAGYLQSYLAKPGVQEGITAWAASRDELKAVEYRGIGHLLSAAITTEAGESAWSAAVTELRRRLGIPGEYNIDLRDAGVALDTPSVSIVAQPGVATASATIPAPSVVTTPVAPGVPQDVLVLWLAIFLNALFVVAIIYWPHLSAEVQAIVTTYVGGGGIMSGVWAYKRYSGRRKRDGRN